MIWREPRINRWQMEINIKLGGHMALEKMCPSSKTCHSYLVRVVANMAP
jgi:hypothetical protein